MLWGVCTTKTVSSWSPALQIWHENLQLGYSLENGTAVNHIRLCERLTAALRQLRVSTAEARHAEHTVAVAWVFHQFYGRVAKKKPMLKMLILHLGWWKLAYAQQPMQSDTARGVSHGQLRITDFERQL